MNQTKINRTDKRCECWTGEGGHHTGLCECPLHDDPTHEPQVELPKVKQKLIDIQEFEDISGKVKKSFEEEQAYIESKEQTRECKHCKDIKTNYDCPCWFEGYLMGEAEDHTENKLVKTDNKGVDGMDTLPKIKKKKLINLKKFEVSKERLGIHEK